MQPPTMSTRRSTRSNSRQHQHSHQQPAPPRPPTKRSRSDQGEGEDADDMDGQSGNDCSGPPARKLKSPKPEPNPTTPAAGNSQHDLRPAAAAKTSMTMEWPDSALAASINHLACHLFGPSSLHSLDGSALYALGMLIKTHADSFFEPPPPRARPPPITEAVIPQSEQDEVTALRADLDARRPIDYSDSRVTEILAKVHERNRAKEEQKKQAIRESTAKGLATWLAGRAAEYAKYGLNPDGTRMGMPPKVRVHRPVVEDQTFHALASNPHWCALCRKLGDPTRKKYNRPKLRLVYSAMVDAYLPLHVCDMCTGHLFIRPVHCPYCYRICSSSHVPAACKYVEDNPSAAVRSKIKAGSVPEPLKCPKCSHRMRVLDDDDPLFIKRVEEAVLPPRTVRLQEVPKGDEGAPVDWPSRVAADREEAREK